MTIYFIFTALLLILLVALLWPLRKNIAFCIITAFIFFTASFALYYQFGAVDILPLLKKREEKLANLKDIISTASSAVRANPSNIQAWIILGDSFMETNQYSAAANAYKEAVLLSQGNPAYIMAYARALIANADGKINDDAKKSLQMALILQPENPEAKYFLAVRALQEGKTQQAMFAMKSLYKTLPDDSPLKNMIDRKIGRK